jgi:hypothetical protein
MNTAAEAVRSLVRGVLFEQGGGDSEDGPIGPSPLERIRATGEPVSFKSDVTKLKNIAAKVQDSPIYRIGMGAWSGGLVGAAHATGTHVPSTLSKPGEFLTRPEVTMALGTVIPGAGIGSAAKGILGATTRGIGSELGNQMASTVGAPSRYIPKLDPVASYSTPTSLVTAPLSGKDPFKK